MQNWRTHTKEERAVVKYKDNAEILAETFSKIAQVTLVSKERKEGKPQIIV